MKIWSKSISMSLEDAINVWIDYHNKIKWKYMEEKYNVSHYRILDILNERFHKQSRNIASNRIGSKINPYEGRRKIKVLKRTRKLRLRSRSENQLEIEFTAST
jgi:hypothetical protein